MAFYIFQENKLTYYGVHCPKVCRKEVEVLYIIHLTCDPNHLQGWKVTANKKYKQNRD